MRRLLALLTVLSVAHAEPVRQVVPYSGYLDFDGEPYTGTAQMRFRVFDVDREGVAVWEECHPAVRAHGGSFAVRLGQPAGEGAVATPVGPLLASGTQYWLELSVRLAEGACEAAAEDWVTLSGRQQISPAPQSVWAAKATDFTVAGELAVGSNARVGGALDVEGNVATRGTTRLDRAGAPQAGEPFGYSWPLRIGRLGVSDTLLINEHMAQAERNGGPVQLYLNYFGGTVSVGGGGGTQLRVHGTTHTDALAVGSGLPIGLSAPVNIAAECNGNCGEQGRLLNVAGGRSACFLTRNHSFRRGNDGLAGTTVCKVYLGADNQWRVVSVMNGNGYKYMDCEARCITW